MIATGQARKRIARALLDGGYRPHASRRSGRPVKTDTPSSAPAVIGLRDGARPTEQLEALKRRAPDTPVIAVIERGDGRDVRALLAAGASGIVLYEELERALPACVAAVRAGQACVPASHARQIQPHALSAREKQILGLVVMGYMNGQIADRLFLAESTVKSHLQSAFAKLGVRSRHDAVELIVNPEHGLGAGILALGGEPLQKESPRT